MVATECVKWQNSDVAEAKSLGCLSQSGNHVNKQVHLIPISRRYYACFTDQKTSEIAEGHTVLVLL